VATASGPAIKDGHSLTSSSSAEAGTEMVKERGCPLTAVSPRCTGERMDHPRPISQLRARQPAPPWPFAKRNSSA
jgi:hypothetical protein